MLILIVADVLGVENNGTTVAAYNLISYLKKQGHSVRVLCCDKDKKNIPDFFVCDPINFYIFNNYVKKNGVAPAKPDIEIINKAIDGVDFIHLMMPFAASCKIAKIANKKKIPMSAGFHVQAENITSHLFLMHCPFFIKVTYQIFWKKLYRYIDIIHYPTKFIKNDFERIVGPTNGYIISNGVKNLYKKKESKRPQELVDKFVILTTGRYTKEKMQYKLIKAIRYSKYKNHIQLIIAGDGPQRKHLTRLSKKLPYKPILGIHKQEELVDIINYSDLYVHTAYAELESIACLEAIKCGLVPIINNSKRSATRYFALSDKNLFKKNSTKDLAKKIDFWIEHEEERKECSKKYLDNYSNRVDFDSCMKKMETMMYDAVKLRKYKIDNDLKGRVILYNDSTNDDFAGTHITTEKISDNFIYNNQNILWKFLSFIIYNIIAKPILYIFGKCVLGIKVYNKKAIKKIKKTGYFIYGNHTTVYDGFIPQVFVNKSKRKYVIANPDATSIKGIKNIVMMLGALPLPSTLKSAENFIKTIKYRIDHKNAIIIYPEAHIWPYYDGIRDFSTGAFRYPAQLNAPIVVSVITYRKSKFRKKPLINVTLSEPIYPNKDLTLKENMVFLHDKVYIFLKETIEKNGKVDYINYVHNEKILNKK